MVLTREDLRNQLKRHEIAPVYLLFGPETYLCDLAAKTITERAFSKEDFRDLNDTSFSLNNADSLQQAIAAAEQLPMMSSRRVVRITDVRISATGFRDTITEAHEAALSAYLKNPSTTTVVIFVADELNGVRKMSKLLKENTTAVEFKALSDHELTSWARDKFVDAGAEIDNIVLNQLIARIGPDVRRLTNEVNKLSAAALPNKTITSELVASLVPDSREMNSFAFTDHLIAGRASQAVTTLKKILDDGAEPLMLLGSLSYTFRRLLMAKDMMEHGRDRRDVANAVKLRYNNQEPFLAAARRAKLNNLTKAIQRLAQTDLAIKTSVGGSTSGARMQIEMLVCELATM
jgi:DNA polymerase III subunit delta